MVKLTDCTIDNWRMLKVKSVDDLMNGIACVRDKRKGFETNFFLDENKHGFWISKGDMYYKEIGNTFFIIKDNESFRNLFFATTDRDSLYEDLKSLLNAVDDKTSVIDLIGRARQLEPLSDLLRNQDFNNVCNLVRMSRISPVIPFEEVFNEVKYAISEDAIQISNLLLQYFDKELEQIPYLEEIEEMISHNQVLVYRENERVAGFVIFEKNSSTLYLRYWFVHPDFREKRIGGAMLRKFFYIGNDTKRQILWVVKSNENSLKRYIHYGFKEDGLEDRIYLSGKFIPNPLTTNNL